MRPDIEAIEGRWFDSTPGSWVVSKVSSTGKVLWFNHVPGLDLDESGRCVWENMRCVDHDFIANAHQDIPALIAYVRELEAENERLRGAYDDCVNECTDRVSVAREARDNARNEAVEQVQSEMATLRAAVARLEAKCRQQQQEMMAIQTELSRSVVQ